MKITTSIQEKDNDITDEEWEELHLPYQDNLNNFMINYIIPEVVCFGLANSHFRGCLCKATFKQHFNSIKDIILVPITLDEVKDEIVKLLNIKYNLEITNEDPLAFNKCQ